MKPVEKEHKPISQSCDLLSDDLALERRIPIKINQKEQYDEDSFIFG